MEREARVIAGDESDQERCEVDSDFGSADRERRASEQWALLFRRYLVVRRYLEARALPRWAHLVRLYRRIRRQQRYWHNLGQALQNVDCAARERVKKVWPPPKREV